MTEFVCVDCGRGYVLTVSQERFFDSRGLSRPKRCKQCLSDRKPRSITLRTNARLRVAIDGEPVPCDLMVERVYQNMGDVVGLSLRSVAPLPTEDVGADADAHAGGSTNARSIAKGTIE